MNAICLIDPRGGAFPRLGDASRNSNFSVLLTFWPLKVPLGLPYRFFKTIMNQGLEGFDFQSALSIARP